MRTLSASIFSVAAAAALLLIAVANTAADVEIQGHRGARGLLPENTLPSFAKAISLGVDVLELDTAVTSDGIVVVSHDPKLNPDFTRDANGQWVTAPGPVIAALSLSEIKNYDVGRIRPDSDYAKRFPDQTPLDGTPIPTLEEVAALVASAGNGAVRFNIETKVRPDGAALTFAPEAFTERLVATVRAAGIAERTVIQSFYWRTLAHVQAIAPEISTACLTSEQSWFDNIGREAGGPSPWTGMDVNAFGGSVLRMVKASGCAIWSPFHGEVDQTSVGAAHGLGLKVIVWTVNAPEQMRTLIEIGVDGIITDYPDRLRAVMRELGMRVPEATPVRISPQDLDAAD
ncbi:MAG: glycerophosphodiester phosphodiesterase [Gammaproteobacteria bacterium]|nr:glycerophosphodiester phosphodiesterase [Gammaproteobacteria bacterium]MDH3413097.1 glycerophosphodiester phosphodiesterase [Gammaproteobacteria bacterium]